MVKNYFIAGAAACVIIVSIKNIFYVPAGELAALRDQVASAEMQLAQTSDNLDRVRDRYLSMVDSLGRERDSLNAIAVESRAIAERVRTSYSRRSDELVDSLRLAGNQVIANELESLRASHDSVVVALNTEIDALNADRALLWRRVAMADSVIGAQAMQIQASEAVAAALSDERDAWRAKATPSLPKRLVRSLPAVLATAVIVSTLGG